MADFLLKTLSPERWKTYERLSHHTGLPAEILYARNLIYSKELYVMLAGMEVVVRNAFHEELKQYFRREDWMSNLKLFRGSHKEQLDKAIEKLVQNKSGGYVVPDLIAELNFGFWAHLADAPYEQVFWIPALRHAFPAKFGKPIRQDIESRLKNLLRLRNKIAHLEPIVRYEPQLMQAYQSAYDIISWICPTTAEWFDATSDFKKIWLKNNGSTRVDKD